MKKFATLLILASIAGYSTGCQAPAGPVKDGKCIEQGSQAVPGLVDPDCAAAPAK